jgi:hypothetical protein
MAPEKSWVCALLRPAPEAVPARVDPEAAADADVGADEEVEEGTAA